MLPVSGNLMLQNRHDSEVEEPHSAVSHLRSEIRHTSILPICQIGEIPYQ